MICPNCAKDITEIRVNCTVCGKGVLSDHVIKVGESCLCVACLVVQINTQLKEENKFKRKTPAPLVKAEYWEETKEWVLDPEKDRD